MKGYYKFCWVLSTVGLKNFCYVYSAKPCGVLCGNLLARHCSKLMYCTCCNLLARRKMGPLRGRSHFSRAAQRARKWASPVGAPSFYVQRDLNRININTY